MADRVLRCPSCDGPMQVAERRGVLIDVCRECRGVFLDRGELDKLLDAAAAASIGSADDVASSRDDEFERRRDRDDDWSDRRDREWKHRHGRRREGFLDDIFDFG